MPAVDARGDSVETAVLAMEAAAGAPVEVTRSPLTDLVSFVTTGPGHPVRLDVPASARASERALAFLGAYGKAFGIGDPSRFRVLRATLKDQVGMEHVRLQQLHKGIPVTAGELSVHLRGASVVSVLAKTLPDPADLETTPEIGAGEAGAIVSELLREKRLIQDAELSTPRLEILNKGLLEGVSSPSRLAWFLVASKVDVREYFWVDAARGAILLTFSQRPNARDRRIHDADSSSGLPGALVRSEGGPPTGDPDADAAYDFSGDTYDYFFNEHGRDSFDGSGAPIVSTVRFCPSSNECPFQNAFWNGAQMVYGEGFSVADDVDAHELTHAVTDFSAELFYYMQSGALNESFSDIFGETVDLTNAGGTDTPAVRWLLGEDVPVFGAVRNMMNPNAFG
ncbi:MAG: M4 family metallopeptidase, partial [bacterium]